MKKQLFVLGLLSVLCLTFLYPNPLAAQGVCDCVGSAEMGGPCYAGVGGPAYAGLGGPAYAGVGGPCYKGAGASKSTDLSAPKKKGFFSRKSSEDRSFSNYDMGGACYAGVGGPCFPGAIGNTCPGFC